MHMVVSCYLLGSEALKHLLFLFLSSFLSSSSCLLLHNYLEDKPHFGREGLLGWKDEGKERGRGGWTELKHTEASKGWMLLWPLTCRSFRKRRWTIISLPPVKRQGVLSIHPSHWLSTNIPCESRLLKLTLPGKKTENILFFYPNTLGDDMNEPIESCLSVIDLSIYPQVFNALVFIFLWKTL